MNSPSIENSLSEIIPEIPEAPVIIFGQLHIDDKKQVPLTAKHFKDAVDGTITHVKAYDSEQLRQALKKFGPLSGKELHIEFDTDFKFTKDLKQILSNPRIVSLDFSRRSDVTDEDLACLSACQDLQELNLANCIGLNGNFLEHLAYPEKITVLNLSGFTNLFEERHTTVLAKLQNLQKLDLANYRGLAWSFLSHLPCPEKLIVLDLSFIDLIDRQLATILGKFINLHELKLFSCWEIANDFLLPLKNLENLAILNFSGCFNLVDKNLLTVLAKCPNLQELILCHCKKLTGEFVPYLRNLQKLKNVGVAGCVRISPAKLEQLKQLNKEKESSC